MKSIKESIHWMDRYMHSFQWKSFYRLYKVLQDKEEVDYMNYIFILQDFLCDVIANRPTNLPKCSEFKYNCSHEFYYNSDLVTFCELKFEKYHWNFTALDVNFINRLVNIVNDITADLIKVYLFKLDAKDAFNHIDITILKPLLGDNK